MVDVDKQISELFQAKAHLGHKKSRVHPKAKKYIYSFENNISIIDLTKTQVCLTSALNFVEKLAKENKVLLIVVTKKIAATKIQSLCQENSIPHVGIKWPAGLLTNFETITKNIKKLISMKKDSAEGIWSKYVKHDRLKLQKELTKLEKAYGGLISLERLPDAVFVVDIKKEKNAVNESRKKNIPILAVCDTNVDPQLIDFPIPANDDLLSSIEYIASKIINSYAKFKQN